MEKKSRPYSTWEILRLVVAAWLLYMIYTIAIHQIVQGNEKEKHAYFSMLATEWSIPNTRGEPRLVNESVSRGGTQTYSYPLTKMVGNEESYMGEATITQKIFSEPRITRVATGRERLSDFGIGMPEDPRTGKQLLEDPNPRVWSTLEKLPEGTVGELAFATTRFMTARQLVELLEPFDLHILWMPLYTGEYETYDPGGGSSSENWFQPHGVIGLTGGRDHGENYRGGYTMLWIDSAEKVEESETLMLQNMEKMLMESEEYIAQFLGLGHLEEKYNYLKEEGFTVYGAVVTGPVKELLKLRELDFVQGEILGDVELWRWDPVE